MFVCLFVCLFRMADQTTGPIETKLDTRTHVHPGSVSGKVNLKVINVCVREWQKTWENGATATPSERRAHYVRTTADDDGGDT